MEEDPRVQTQELIDAGVDEKKLYERLLVPRLCDALDKIFGSRSMSEQAEGVAEGRMLFTIIAKLDRAPLDMELLVELYREEQKRRAKSENDSVRRRTHASSLL